MTKHITQLLRGKKWKEVQRHFKQQRKYQTILTTYHMTNNSMLNNICQTLGLKCCQALKWQIKSVFMSHWDILWKFSKKYIHPLSFTKRALKNKWSRNSALALQTITKYLLIMSNLFTKFWEKKNDKCHLFSSTSSKICFKISQKEKEEKNKKQNIYFSLTGFIVNNS